MNLDKIREEMKNYTIEEIARGTGLSRPTIMRIRDSENFTYANLVLVENYIKNNKR